MKKKLLGILLCVALMTTGLVGCGSDTEDTTSDTTTESNAEAEENTTADESSSFDTDNEIVVVSREDGSGTRGAFIELTGVEEKDEDGNKIDNTTEEAIISNSTAAVMTTVAENDYAIGYISLGSLNDTVKAVTVGGVEATADNINDGSYELSRPFNIVTKGSVDDAAQDFIDFIMSADGQAIISENGYIEVENTGSFAGGDVSGTVVVAGSSSVTPVMEKLKEAYEAINENVSIEVQESDSTTGITAVSEETCQIGMASRELKDEEVELGLSSTVIAMDGIAVIVNTNNTVEDLSLEQIKNIFCGDTVTWADVQ